MLKFNECWLFELFYNFYDVQYVYKVFHSHIVLLMTPPLTFPLYLLCPYVSHPTLTTKYVHCQTIQ